MDPGGEQRFTGVDIPHAHHQLVIHQPGFDRGFLLRAFLLEIVGVERVAERLRAKMGQYRMAFQRSGPQPGAKAAWIGVAQHLAVTHDQVNVIVFFSRQLFAQDAQAPRHPKMDDDPAVRQLQKQVLGAATHAENRNVAQAINLFGNRPAQPSVAHDGVQNGCANQVRLDAATAGFNLW